MYSFAKYHRLKVKGQGQCYNKINHLAALVTSYKLQTSNEQSYTVTCIIANE